MYQYANGNPFKYTDPRGLDFVYLNDPSAANIPPFGPQGHAGFLVGNDKYGWSYYSKNGGPSNTDASYGTLNDFLRSQDASRYQNLAYIPTTLQQDMLIMGYADQHYRDPYNLLSNNCGDLVHNSAAAGGVGIPGGDNLPTRPNQQYQGVLGLPGGMSVPSQFDQYPYTPKP